jgi:2'-5' RNA ligase
MAIRSFIALDTPLAIREQMADLQSKLREAGADVRWEPMEKFHATIKFLGNVDENSLPKIITTIGHALKEFHPFTLAYTRLGCFPRVHQPRVIWIGCQDIDGTLQKIKETLDNVLVPFGFEREDRAFHPHVTLGRVRSMKNIRLLIPKLETLTFDSPSIVCNAINLMKSILKPQGSEYVVIHTFELGGETQ